VLVFEKGPNTQQRAIVIKAKQEDLLSFQARDGEQAFGFSPLASFEENCS